MEQNPGTSALGEVAGGTSLEEMLWVRERRACRMARSLCRARRGPVKAGRTTSTGTPGAHLPPGEQKLPTTKEPGR